MMVIMLMTGIFTSCEMIHEDIPECNRVILKFNNVTANDTDTFGLYVLSKNDIIVEENIKVSSNYEIEKDLYETRGDKYFIYTPYFSNNVFGISSVTNGFFIDKYTLSI